MKSIRSFVPLLLLTLVPAATLSTSAFASDKEILIDAVVASVDGNPITLSQLGKRLSPPRALSLKEASIDPDARLALDGLIQEQVIREEAALQRVAVSPAEVEDYLREVGLRNQLTLEELEKVIVDEGRTLNDYKRTVEIEILKTKLVSRFARSGAGVTEQEARDYIEENKHLSESGSKMKLSQIVVYSGEDTEAAKEKISKVEELLKNGESFRAVASQLSDGPEASEGGALGVIAEKDLNPLIFDAVFTLEEGERSEVVESAAGFHIFRVEERFVDQDEEASERLLDEVKQMLGKRKIELRVNSYLSTELLKNHHIDKKI